jgi:hypothetical protein
MYIKDFHTGIILPLFFTPVIRDLYNIQTHRFSKESIIKAINKVSFKPFVLILFFMCLLSV